MTIGVYMIEHVATGRRYIGKSVDVEHRIAVHFTPGQHERSTSHIHKAIGKYGRDAFRVVVLEHCDDDETARAREVVWIRALETKTPNGFNLTDGGDGTSGFRPSDETRAKLSAARRGSKRSAETRAKMSAAQRGRPRHSDETKAKIAASKLGNTYSVGRKLSEETRAKISAGNTGKEISADVRARMSARLKGKVPARNLREVSPEIREKIAAAGRGRKHSAETREKMRQAWVRRKESANG